MTTAQRQAALASAERKRALEFIPALKWPWWPFLPMKRGPQNEELGFLYADNATDRDGVILYKTDMYSWSQMDAEGRKSVVTIHYPTVAALLDDGWRVD